MVKLDGNKVELCGTGSGGLAELKSGFSDPDVQWAVLKVEAHDVKKNVTSKRTKFIFITWIGPDVPVMKKAKVSLSSQGVRKLFQGVAIYVDVSHASELEGDELSKRLLQVGGAHKPTLFRFGPDQDVPVVGAATA